MIEMNPRSKDAPVLSLRDISKGFPNVQALQSIDLDIRRGEVLALMGENGAGKSTLLKILAGSYHPDVGEISIDGVPTHLSSPKAARVAGIRIVHQEPEIIQFVDVAENVLVGALPSARFDRSVVRSAVQDRIDEIGFQSRITPRLRGADLSPAQRQMVEILRALEAGAKVVCFDEPTSSLTDDEVDDLFKLIARLRSENVAIIYVSHRMTEILRIADRVAVLRDGRLVLDELASELTEDKIVQSMVGRSLGTMFPEKALNVADQHPALTVRHLSSRWHHDISFDIHAGEIVGFAGLIGAGRSELAKVLYGELPKTAGSVAIDGEEVEINSTTEAIRLGLGLAPEDRKTEGLFLSRSIGENITLPILDRLSRFGFIKRRADRAKAREYSQRLAIKAPTIDAEANTLSGGNQQKVVLARWLLLLDEPTRGIDVGAKAEIYKLIRDLAQGGLAIMLISSEMIEVIGLCDRILVMAGGRITGQFDSDDATEEAILSAAMITEDEGNRNS